MKPPVWLLAVPYMGDSKKLNIHFLGYNIPYPDGMATMRKHIEDFDTYGPTLLLLEHADTITYTKSHGLKHVFATKEELQSRGLALCETDRGGDVTFHGKGQLVGYPVLKLPKQSDSLPFDLIGYIRKLEQALLQACLELGVANATTLPKKTGVWANSLSRWSGKGQGEGVLKKLIAIGVGVTKDGITKHGFALNINTDLEHLTQGIIPCGIKDLGVTSLERIFQAQNKPAPSFENVVKVVSQWVALQFST